VSDHWATRFLRRLRGQPEDDAQQQLLRLYWNRAELKKELLNLQSQQSRLVAKLDAQQSASRQADSKLDQLAELLGRPEAGPRALLYFQLRALWRESSRKLAEFVAELRRQQEDRERRRHAAECEAARAARLAELEARLLDAQSIADSLQARLKLLTDKLAALRGFWNYRRRREVRAELAQLHAQQEVATANAAALADERTALAGAAPEQFPGLSVEGRRMVNTAAIAFAELLIVNLPQRRLAALARHAVSVQIFDADFGPPADCVQCMDLLRKTLAPGNHAAQNLMALKEPTERVRNQAEYRSSQDVTPLADSLADVPLHPEGRNPSPERLPEGVNILAEDYWSISQVLLQ
jgi:hypothetical protein